MLRVTEDDKKNSGTVAPLAAANRSFGAHRPARRGRSYQMDEDLEEAQETSLPLDFGDSLPPRLTPLADKQFREGGDTESVSLNPLNLVTLSI